MGTKRETLLAPAGVPRRDTLLGIRFDAKRRERLSSVRKTLLPPTPCFAANDEGFAPGEACAGEEDAQESQVSSRHTLSIVPPPSELSMALGDIIPSLVRRRSDLPRLERCSVTPSTAI
jgi:hypothetical protein